VRRTIGRQLAHTGNGKSVARGRGKRDRLQQLGVAVAELREVTVGWSAKRQILGQSVYNDKGEAIGKADDIIIAPDKAVSYAIIGAGGFLGVGKHDVAIPVSQLKESDGKIVLAGATKEVIKAMPPFEYAR